MTLDDITLDLIKTEWLGLPSSHENGLINTQYEVAKATVQQSIGYSLSEIPVEQQPLAIGAIQIAIYHWFYNLEPVGGHAISPTFTYFIRELKDWRL